MPDWPKEMWICPTCGALQATRGCLNLSLDAHPEGRPTPGEMVRVEVVPAGIEDMREEMVTAAREALIESDDVIGVGEEPFTGWSLILAERAVDAALSGLGGVSVTEEEK